MLNWFLGKLRNYGKEAYVFPGGRLEEQTRGSCPHILALANTRISLRAWREDLGDITRILLTAMAGLLAQWGARMSDTITLCTRILLTAWDLHSKKIDHGGFSGVWSTRGTYRKKHGWIVELLSLGSDRHFIAGPERWVQVPVKQWFSHESFEAWAHELT